MMAIVGGYIGGGVSMVPAGSSQVILQWYTNDGANLKCTFSLVSSSKTYNIASDDHGYAEAIVDSGEYTISVSHSGQYEGDKPVVRTMKSTESYNIVFWGLAASSGLSIINNKNFDTTYSILSADGVEVRSGVLSSSNIDIGIVGGTYTVKVSLLGETLSFNITIIQNSVSVLDLAEHYCKVTLSASTPSDEIYLIMNGKRTQMSNKVAYIFKSSSERTVSYEDMANYSGVINSKMCSISDGVIPGGASTVTNSPSVVGRVAIITDSGDLNVSKGGKFQILVVGGGAKGVRLKQWYASISSGGSAYNQYGGSGGGSGNMATSLVSLNTGVFPITIGPGATISTAAGGITSFGTILSAEGGYLKDGGAGGGGGGSEYDSADNDNTSESGGNGAFGGGGGSGASGSGSYRDTGVFGTGGTYGGNGSGLQSGSSKVILATDGTAPPENTIFDSSLVFGIASDSAAGVGYYGGGGGYGAKGGQGWDTSNAYKNAHHGGGGGGGIAGGGGGRGGTGGSGTKHNPGEGGYGYGAGGGGGCAETSLSNYRRGGGGGGGGYGSSVKADDGGRSSSTSSNEYVECGGNGYKGCAVIQWRSRT